MIFKCNNMSNHAGHYRRNNEYDKVKKNRQMSKVMKVLIPLVIVAVIAAVIAAEKDVIRQKVNSIFYDVAIERMENGEYDIAKEIFGRMPEYLDSAVYVEMLDWAVLGKSKTGGVCIMSVNEDKMPEQVVIPGSVTCIGTDTFRRCRSLTSITIPDSVTEIGKGAFGGCRSLTSITIPDGVKLGVGVFEDTPLEGQY